MLTADDRGKHRVYTDTDGKEFVSVTSSMKLIQEQLREPDPFASVPLALLKMHQAEGTACHTVCLNWLAVREGLLPSFTIPSWPAYDHPDEARWQNVLCNAMTGFQQWVESRMFEATMIEQESVNRTYGFAGRPDIGGFIQWRKRRIMTVIDLKFTAGIMRSHEMQVRLYGKLDGYQQSSLGLIVRIDRETGAVQEREVYLDQRPEDTVAALCATQLYRWAINNRAL